MNVTLWAFIATLLFAGLLAANIWSFFVRPARPWSARLGLVLQITELGHLYERGASGVAAGCESVTRLTQ